MGTVITPRENEKVLFTIRKNFFKYYKEILKLKLLIFISIFIFLFSPNEILTYVGVATFLFAIIYGIYHFFVWFYDVYIITNQRVIMVEKKNPFSKEYREVNHTDIRDVTYQVKGVFETIFRFGDVKISGNDFELNLCCLSRPDEVQEMIKRLVEATHKLSHH